MQNDSLLVLSLPLSQSARQSLSIILSVCPWHLSRSLSIHPLVRESICQSVCLSGRKSVILRHSVCLYVCLSAIFQVGSQAVSQPVCVSVCLSVCQAVGQSVSQLDRQSVASVRQASRQAVIRQADSQSDS